MKKTTWILTIFALLAALLAGYFWWQRSSEEAAFVTETVAPPPVAAAPPLETAAPATVTPPRVLHAIEPAPLKNPLPAIDESDPLLTQALQALVGSDLWRATFFPDLIVRRIVATIDNLPRKEASTKVWPLRPVGSWLATTGGGTDLRIAASNAQRYARYIELVQAVDVNKLADLYRQFYPLFQRAYVELGYPDAYFNDRLVIVIDDLLAAPELTEPPRLVQKKVLYQFADPDLESRSAGQKIMLRIGAENMRIVKAKLRALRAAVTRSGLNPS